MIKLEARGLSCPEPLMMVAEALKKNPGSEIEVLVDEMHTKTNIENYCHDHGLKVDSVVDKFDIRMNIK